MGRELRGGAKIGHRGKRGVEARVQQEENEGRECAVNSTRRLLAQSAPATCPAGTHTPNTASQGASPCTPKIPQPRHPTLPPFAARHRHTGKSKR
eukprot:111483-Chlamydomonas_euryale.AAC.1